MTSEEHHILRQMNANYSEIGAVYHDAALRLGLSDSSCKILYAIAENGHSLPLHTVAVTTGLPKQTINSALRKLEQDGIITLNPIDGKAKLITLTFKGETLAANTVCRLMDIENQIYNTWSSAEIRTYLELTQRFLQLIRAQLDTLSPGKHS